MIRTLQKLLRPDRPLPSAPARSYSPRATIPTMPNGLRQPSSQFCCAGCGAVLAEYIAGSVLIRNATREVRPDGALVLTCEQCQRGEMR